MPSTSTKKHSAQKSARPIQAALVSAPQRALIEQAAALSGCNVSDFARDILVMAASSIVQQHRGIRLNSAETAELLEALDETPAPAPALRKAIRDHRRTVKDR